MTGLVSDHVNTATGQVLQQALTANWEKLVFLDRVIENDVNHRNIANKQTTVMASMAISFALIALGFSLFVMGIEAAYEISVTSPTYSLVLQACSPGLLCFLLAAAVVCVGLTRKADVNYLPMTKEFGYVPVILKDPNSPGSVTSPATPVKDVSGSNGKSHIGEAADSPPAQVPGPNFTPDPFHTENPIKGVTAGSATAVQEFPVKDIPPAAGSVTDTIRPFVVVGETPGWDKKLLDDTPKAAGSSH